MGVLAQSPLGRRGLALPSAMFALVAVSLLVVGLFVVTDLAARGGRNRERAARALHIAEAGLAHALGAARDSLRGRNLTNLLRGLDNIAGTADDSVLDLYPNLLPANWIPLAGKQVAALGGRYFVTLRDDPADPNPAPLTDGNNRIIARCRGVFDEGGEAVVEAIIGSFLLPGVATDGDLEISATPTIVTGACGSVHANGDITGGGAANTTGGVSAEGSIDVPATPTSTPNADSIEIPDLPFNQFCPMGGATNLAFPPGTEYVLPSTATGIYCITADNVKISDMGSNSLAGAKPLTVITTGAIEISGKPYIKSAHPDGLLLVAGGDLSLSGDWVGGDNLWLGDGTVFGGGQCYISGKPIIHAQLICKNKASPPGKNHIDKNLISGEAVINFGCGSLLGKRRIFSWYPVLGS